MTEPTKELSLENDWVSLEGVWLVRDRRTILEDVHWRIERGEHWVVLGANGSGKTTLLQLLAGYLWPTRGQITVLGERFGQTDLRALRRRIGWVGSFLQAQIPFKQNPLDLIVSGRFASIGIFDTPTEKDYANAGRLAARLHCEEVLDRPYGVLSQGEKQRLLIARALVHEPELLILDEPCAGLDLVAREELLHTLEQLGRDGTGPTLILVTHHLEEITPAFTHVLILREGRCAAQGRKDETLQPLVLSEAFGISLEVHSEGERYWARPVIP